MIDQLIQQLLEKLTKTYGKDKKKYLPKAHWEYPKEETEYLESKGQLDAQELLSLQPSYRLDESDIEADMTTAIYESYQEFADEWLDAFEDKYIARLNQIIAWTIHTDMEDVQEGEEAEFLIHLAILQPRFNVIKNIFIKITKEDTPKIKRLLRKAALFNLYNFSQAFK